VNEEYEELVEGLEAAERVLKPGGIFCFDTINSTLLARLVVVLVAERVLALLPRGTHDPGLFIKPAALREMLGARGFDVGPFRGLAPTGINRRLDFTFGIVPMTGIIYVGTATKG
ncbi:MAG: 3-demethylubiquinone-9 3-O-methyltransferase, partial [Pseudomonadota bacterium]